MKNKIYHVQIKVGGMLFTHDTPDASSIGPWMVSIAAEYVNCEMQITMNVWEMRA